MKEYKTNYEKVREWKLKNKDKVKEQQRRYREKNKEKLNAYRRFRYKRAERIIKYLEQVKKDALEVENEYAYEIATDVENILKGEDK